MATHGFHYADILIAPVISERTNDLMITENKYVFMVTERATKNDVKRAILEKYKVAPKDVNIINLPRKPKRAGRFQYMSGKRRKAIVSLNEGDKIRDLSEAAV